MPNNSTIQSLFVGVVFAAAHCFVTAPVGFGQVNSAGRGVDIPRTNLTPLNSTPFNPGSAPATTGTFNQGTFNPPSASFGANQGSSATLFDPYATGAVSAGPTGSFATPGSASSVPLGSAPAPVNNYPGGSFLGALFSRPSSAPNAGFFGGSTVPQTSAFGTPAFGASAPFGTSTISPPQYGAPQTGVLPQYGAPQYGLAPQYGAGGTFGGTSGTLAPQGNFVSPPGGYGYSQPPVGQFGQPAFPSSIYPSQTPSTLYPGGLFGGGGLFAGGGTNGFNAYQLLRRPRVQFAYLGGGNKSDDVGINDIDASIALAWQNFLYSSQPLYIVPSFGLHLWDGPITSAGQTADLPSSVYDGFLDFAWQSDPNQMLGAEIGVRVGAFTDFEVFNSDSIRVRGKGLLAFRLSPASTLKAGIYYLDRNGTKLLPAGGVLWQPDPYTRFDIFFPQPKLARYWRTVGTSDVWWYLSGDYGGGSWTIERADQTEDSVDLNDIRVMFGFEWGRSDLIRAGRRHAFVEAGYVFDREVEYKRNPQDDFTPDDTFMFRIGIGY